MAHRGRCTKTTPGPRECPSLVTPSFPLRAWEVRRRIPLREAAEVNGLLRPRDGAPPEAQVAHRTARTGAPSDCRGGERPRHPCPPPPTRRPAVPREMARPPPPPGQT